MKSVGEKVAEFRRAKGWTVVEMADKVGTSRQNIENLEKNEVGSPRYLHKLAKVMGISMDALVGTTPYEPPEEVPAVQGEAERLLGQIESIVHLLPQDARVSALESALKALLAHLPPPAKQRPSTPGLP